MDAIVANISKLIVRLGSLVTIDEAQAKDNVITVYYPEDKADSSYVGLVYMETSVLRMFMDSIGKLSRKIPAHH